jgi:hypothetical protein
MFLLIITLVSISDLIFLTTGNNLICSITARGHDEKIRSGPRPRKGCLVPAFRRPCNGIDSKSRFLCVRKLNSYFVSLFIEDNIIFLAHQFIKKYKQVTI